MFLMKVSSLHIVFLVSPKLIVLLCIHGQLKIILYHPFHLVEKYCHYLYIYQQAQLSIARRFYTLLQELLEFLFRGDPR